MRRFWSGYTVIEVMIVLAVTGVLFSSAVLVFHGQQGRTSLTQNMYDFASKLQSYVGEVNSGIYSGSQSYTCSISSGKAVLTASASDTLGTNDSCIYLGKVVQLIPSSSDVYVYTVIGNRNLYNGANDTGKFAQSLEDTHPQVATAGGSMVLVNKYSFPSDITFDSASATATDGSALSGYGDLVGLFGDLSGSGASANLEPIAYPFPNGGGGNTPYSTTMADCISLNATCASSSNGYSGTGYRRISNWKVCVQAGGGTKAEVKVKTSAAGISTEVDTQSCS